MSQSLRSQAETALNAIAAFSQGTQPIDCDAAGQRFHSELTALDTLACAFQRFDLTATALGAASMDRLKQVAEALARRLTYLLEPISPVEVDAQQCVIQLRSNPPQRGETGSSYYELLVARGGRLSLVRYAKEPQTPRRLVPAQVTREVFLRLIADFSAAAAS